MDGGGKTVKEEFSGLEVKGGILVPVAAGAAALVEQLRAERDCYRVALKRIERITGSTGGAKALVEENRTTARLALARWGQV